MSTEKICNHCGEVINIDTDNWIEHDGEFYHQDCFDENFTFCDECQEYHPNNEMNYLDNLDISVCDSCMTSEYVRCNHCGNWMRECDAYIGADDESYCEDCFWEYFYRCDHCDEVLYRDDVYWDEDGDYGYCYDCYQRICGSHVIYSYHDDDVEYLPKYLNEYDRDTHIKDLYGIELEITGSKETAEPFQNIMGDNVVLMRDGSVDGYEMVSMPMTRAYFYKMFVPILKDGLKYLLDNNMRGHNGGGIHIHFRQLGRGLEVANMTQILYGSEDDRKLWRLINQRRESAMSWCSQNPANLYCEPQEILEEGFLYPCGDGNHGTALNFDYRTETHELRIFNSNLRIERVIKNMECLFALEDYVKQQTELVCDTKGFIQFVVDHAENYPELVKFLDEKDGFELAEKFYGTKYMVRLPLSVNEITEPIEDDRDFILKEEYADMFE